MKKEEHLDSLSRFLEYFQGETDRGAALIGAAMIESKLENLLKSTLVDNFSKSELFNGHNSPIGTFSSKIKLSHALGLISDKEAREANLIRKIRNVFAHDLEEVTFSSQPVCNYCLELQASTPGDLKNEKQYRSLYINSVVLLTLVIWKRPDYVKQQTILRQIICDYEL